MCCQQLVLLLAIVVAACNCCCCLQSITLQPRHLSTTNPRTLHTHTQKARANLVRVSHALLCLLIRADVHQELRVGARLRGKAWARARDAIESSRTAKRKPKTKSSNPKPQTPNPKPQTPNPKPQTPNPKPQTPNPKPQTPNPKPQQPAAASASTSGSRRSSCDIRHARGGGTLE